MSAAAAVRGITRDRPRPPGPVAVMAARLSWARRTGRAQGERPAHIVLKQAEDDDVLPHDRYAHEPDIDPDRQGEVVVQRHQGAGERQNGVQRQVPARRELQQIAHARPMGEDERNEKKQVDGGADDGRRRIFQQ